MVDKKDFLKLKQLDRIEFLLRRKNLEERQPKFQWMYFDMVMFGLIGFVYLVAINLYSIAGVETFLEMMSVSLILIRIMIWVTVLGIIFNIVQYFSFKVKHKELEEEFFKREVKPRK